MNKKIEIDRQVKLAMDKVPITDTDGAIYMRADENDVCFLLKGTEETIASMIFSLCLEEEPLYRIIKAVNEAVTEHKKTTN